MLLVDEIMRFSKCVKEAGGKLLDVNIKAPYRLLAILEEELGQTVVYCENTSGDRGVRIHVEDLGSVNVWVKP